MHTQHDQVCGSSGWEHQNRLIIPILVPTCMMGNHIQRIQREPASISQCPAWVERGKLTCTCSSSMLSTGSTKSIISLRETCQLNLHCTQRSEISRLGPTKKKCSFKHIGKNGGTFASRKSPLPHSPTHNRTGQNMAMGYIRICWNFANIPAFLNIKLTNGQQQDNPTGTTLVSSNKRGLSMSHLKLHWMIKALLIIYTKK